MSMKTNAILPAIAAALCLSAAGVEAGNKNSYGGRATVVKTNVLGLNVTVADTGALPSKGGSIDKSMDEMNVLGVLETGLLTAKTSGIKNTAKSFAEVADFGLNVAGLIDVKGNMINSRARAACNKYKRASVTGAAQVALLEINGTPIRVTGARNQTVSLNNLPALPIVGNLVGNLPLIGNLPVVGGLLGNGLGVLDGVEQVATLVINEQKRTVKKNKAAIKVNAIHLTVKVPPVLGLTPGLTLADVEVSHAESSITCR